jgi:hypothetical protein
MFVVEERQDTCYDRIYQVELDNSSLWEGIETPRTDVVVAGMEICL